MAYKASFIMMTIGNFFLQFIEFIGLYALFSRFGSIKGWTLYEVAIFYGVIHCAFALAEGIGRGYDVFHVQVRMGTFDRILLRPRAIPLQILGSEFQLMRVGRLIQGLFVLIYGLVHINQEVGVKEIIVITLAIIGGTSTFIGLFVAQAMLSFFTIQSLEVVNAFTYGGVQMAQYPLNIYKKWFQRLFTVVLPIGAVSYYPLSNLLRNGSPILAYLAPILGISFLLVMLGIFRLGTRYYCSTGS
jgi:ABC-2 type transport system permease protein